jgi:hypothetical protein
MEGFIFMRASSTRIEPQRLTFQFATLYSRALDNTYPSSVNSKCPRHFSGSIPVGLPTIDKLPLLWYFVFIMAYYNRFEGNYDEEMQRIYERRQAVIDAARQKVPSNLDELLANSEDGETDYELEWVDIPNPKVSGSTIRVRPVLMLASGSPEEAREKDRSDKGAYQILLEGRLPTGETEVIGNIFFFYSGGELKHEPAVTIHRKDSSPINDHRWDSADAELFLSLAESALAAQPE